MSSGEAKERLVVRENGGMKADGGKDDWTLMPWEELKEVLEILEFGAKKYSRDNWKKLDRETYEKALARHVVAYLTGETIDSDSGRNHNAHIACNALFLLWHDKQVKPLGDS